MIKATHVCHLYNHDSALDEINLEIHKGEFVAIVGESGSGKSTLLSVLSTLLTPTKGDVFFDGLNYKEIKNIDTFRKEHIGFIFQFHYLIDYLTVKENLQLANERASINDVLVILELLGIAKLVDKFPNQISGGERQRVAIARALINHPTVIFADEPTGNLDSKNSLKVFEILKQLSKNGTTIIVATHDKELSKMADTVYEVQDGQL